MEMKKILITLIVALILPTTIIAQSSGKNTEPLDTIVRLGGRKLIVDVTKVTATDVYYKVPDEETVTSLERKQIQKVIYRNGRVDVFNKPILMMIDETSWEAIIITENADDVKGLYEVGKISSNSSSSSRSKKAAKRSATIRLQKKAANMGAYMILLTKAEAKGGYGEIPGYDMEGIAYSLEAPPVEEDNFEF